MSAAIAIAEPGLTADERRPDHGVLVLITDRADRSRDVARRLGELCACRTIGLMEAEQDMPWSAAAVVVDVSLRHPAKVERLRQLLVGPRAMGRPIGAIMRDDSHPARIQAAALGAAALFSAAAPAKDIVAMLSPDNRTADPADGIVAGKTPALRIEQARRQFTTIFGSVVRGQIIAKSDVEDATASTMAAVADGGIRKWLEMVWRYDDATYQHCLLVTGLAAEFAAGLGFSANDRKLLIKGALLHDLGKAKIPLAILNKPDALSDDEMAVMRTHARIGCDILREQGDYEKTVLDVVLQHHEMLDGSGYPDGIGGGQIGDLVRLVTICDIYAALIERRPYRPAIAPARAFEMLEQMDGKLEGALVRAFGPVAERSAAAAR